MNIGVNPKNHYLECISQVVQNPSKLVFKETLK
jgi:hypothetical protein